MTERTITALYDTRGAAESARDELVALGVPSGDVTLRGAEGGGDYPSGAGPTGGGAATGEAGTGFWGGLAELFAPDEDRHAYAEGVRRGGYLLAANVPDRLEDQAIDALERYDPVDLDQRAESWRQEGWTGHRAGAAATGAGTGADEGAAVAPRGTAYLAEAGTAEAGVGSGAHEERRSDLGVGHDTGAVVATGLAEDAGQRGTAASASTGTSAVNTAATTRGDEGVVEAAEERLRVGKREVRRGGVRVRSYVREIPVEEQVNLRQERVTVERRPVDREVTAGDAVFEERTIEAVERGEEAVVDKDVRVTEEVALGKDVDTRTETVRDTVRKTEVEVEDARAAADVGGDVGRSSAGHEEEERTAAVPPRDPAAG